MRRRRRLEQSNVDPDLPITPMLDMSFQLLAFFILTFQPGPTEGQLSMALPPAGPTAGPPPLETLDQPKPIKLQVECNSAKTKAPSAFVLLREGDTTGTRFTGDEASKIFGDFTNEVNTLKQQKAKIPNLTFEFDEKLSYQFVMNLMDKAKAAGFEKITPGLLAKPK